MPGCAGGNCSNRSNDGFKLYRFPKDDRRRSICLHNCRRKDWTPKTSDRLCEVHFEDSQFFMTPDGQRRLIGTAVPTRFKIHNLPKLLSSKKKWLSKSKEANEEIEGLREENCNLKKMLEEKDMLLNHLNMFLNPDQISALTGRNCEMERRNNN